VAHTLFNDKPLEPRGVRN
jgi:hypothetical protein